MFPFQSPQDRPDPMEEPPPQDDDPNFFALNPMRSSLLSRDLIFEGLFLGELGVGKFPSPIDLARQRWFNGTELMKWSLPGFSMFKADR